MEMAMVDRNSSLHRALWLMMLVGSVAVLVVRLQADANALADDVELTAAQKTELSTWTGQLQEPGRSAKTRLEAASCLLTRTYPQAERVLGELLADASNPAARLAIAEAIARQGGGREAFIEPLLGLLTGEEASAREVAARALATYKDNGVSAKLLGIAADAGQPREVRTATIRAMDGMLDKGVVDALIGLLKDEDPAVVAAAGATLSQLTNITAFGTDAEEWTRWWARNKNKRRSAWLADLANSLAMSKMSLENDNRHLRERIGELMLDLYTATPQGEKQGLILRSLRDSLPVVRQASLRMIMRQIASGQSVPEPILAAVRQVLRDPEPAVRSQAALTLAGLGDALAVNPLLERLDAEQSVAVRSDLLRALGQLRARAALPAVLSELDSPEPGIVASAAGALSRMAEAAPLTSEHKAKAMSAVGEQFRRFGQAKNHLAAREALLEAMGVLGDPESVQTLRGALKDPEPTIRMGAVKGLMRLGDGDAPEAIKPLLADADRGVRQMAIQALGRLSGEEYLEAILQRSDPSVETEAAVRAQAWETVMEVVKPSGPELLRSVIDLLADRPDARSQRIDIMKLYVDALAKAPATQALADARRALGEALLSERRGSEAAGYLAAAYRAYQGESPEAASETWLEWVEALLQANDPSVAKVVGAQEDDGLFARAMTQYRLRLNALSKEGRYPPLISLAEGLVKEVDGRLDDQSRSAVAQMITAARQNQAKADRARVGELAGRLASTDPAVRTSAQGELVAMGARAVPGLLDELERLVSSEAPAPEQEERILAVLGQVAPELTGYDSTASRKQRLERISKWRELL
jgi:HEAT repeat protein